MLYATCHILLGVLMYIMDATGWMCDNCDVVSCHAAVAKVRDLLDMMADGMEKSVKFVTVS